MGTSLPLKGDRSRMNAQTLPSAAPVFSALSARRNASGRPPIARANTCALGPGVELRGLTAPWWVGEGGPR